MEALPALFTTFGVAALLASWVSLLFTSAKEDFTWGLCAFLLPPLAYGYALLRLDIAKESLVLALIGCVLVAAGLA
ncbi:hypothetical protein [Oceanicoccus sp. KOV_DT_Chl]|uniref:hypothetical protein n=1 Tax=Oceanicoccus sp. KOV_DT_Chl TaxID=1904639 RepID=UPI000C7AFBB4|nr:hypothetical protein [Oceanicoccus sp. KOV_DT_Chl]